MTYLLSVKQDKATLLLTFYKSALDRLPVRLLFLLWFSGPVVSDSLQPHGLQHTRPPCLSPSPRVCPSSCPFHRWCHPAISSSDALFSFCPQSLPASGTFPMNHLCASDDQNTGTSASASVFPVNIQGWSPLRLTGLISLLSKGDWTLIKIVCVCVCVCVCVSCLVMSDSLQPHRLQPWSKKWQPIPVFLPGEFRGQRSLVGCRLWGCTESDMTEVT